MIKTRLFWTFWMLFLILGSLASGLAGGLALAALTAVLSVCSGAFCFLSADRISLTFELPSRTEKGEAADCRIILSNSGKLPAAGIRLILELNNHLTGERRRETVSCALAAGAVREKSFSAASMYCGTVSVSAVCMECTDLFRIFRRKRYPEETAKMFVLPVMAEQDFVGIRHAVPRESDTFADGRPGSDLSEIYEIREYQPGDPVRTFHWKATAKADRMMVRVGSFPVDRSILILFDSFCRDKRMLTPARLDRHAERFFCLSRNLTERHLPHTAGWFDEEAGQMVLFELTSEESLADVMESILSLPHRESEKGVLERYLEMPDREDFGTIYLETLQMPEKLPEELADRIDVLGKLTGKG